MSFCAFAVLVTTCIFFSARDRPRVKWDNSQNSTQKMRTTDWDDSWDSWDEHSFEIDDHDFSIEKEKHPYQSKEK